MVPTCPPPACLAPIFLEGHIDSPPPALSPTFALPEKVSQRWSLHSRSTSAGSFGEADHEESLATSTPSRWLGVTSSKAELASLPMISFPDSITVRNTFIHVNSRSASIDEHFTERLVCSCPATLDELPGFTDLAHTGDDEPKFDDFVDMADAESNATVFCEDVIDFTLVSFADSIMVPARAGWEDSTCEHQAESPNREVYGASFQPVVLLRLDEALREPELGSPQMPTVGSSGHHSGTCKPCAYFHRRGCHNGVDCRFCHLCGPGVRKARLQQRRIQQLQNGDRRHRNVRE
mmetsp:Transcript_49043/g.113658  ORF Transcript_49043/g.113658 Transcript_49043/m.113658 type:complete len:292 (-) Transcript_49043:138-1013(-)